MQAPARPLLVLLLVLAHACNREAPRKAAVAPPVEAPAPPAPSSFAVPIEYDITAVLKKVDEVVPRTFGSMDEVKQVGDDPNRHYAFEARRGHFTAQCPMSVR